MMVLVQSLALGLCVFVIGYFLIPIGRHWIAGMLGKAPLSNGTESSTDMIQVTLVAVALDDTISLFLDEAVAWLTKKKKKFEVVVVGNENSNLGDGFAVSKAINSSRGECILLMNSNGGISIESLELLTPHLEQMKTKSGYGIAIGSRAHKLYTTQSLISTLQLWAVHTFCDHHLYDIQSGCVLMTKSTAQKLFSNLHLVGDSFMAEIIFKANKYGWPVVELAVPFADQLPRSPIDILDAIRDILTMRLCFALGIWS